MGHNEYIHPRYNTLGTFVALFCSNTLSNKSTHFTWLKYLHFFLNKYVTGANLALVYFSTLSFHYLAYTCWRVEIIITRV